MGFGVWDSGCSLGSPVCSPSLYISHSLSRALSQAAKLLGEGASLEAQDDLNGMRALHKVSSAISYLTECDDQMVLESQLLHKIVNLLL